MLLALLPVALDIHKHKQAMSTALTYALGRLHTIHCHEDAFTMEAGFFLSVNSASNQTVALCPAGRVCWLLEGWRHATHKNKA